MTDCTNPADLGVTDTWFCKALRWRVHDPAEALAVAATHRRRAAEKRLRHPGFELQAARHEQLAAICEEHAAALVGGRP